MTKVRKTLVFIIVIILGVAGILIWWEAGRRPPDTNDKSEKTFVIEAGEDIRLIANSLKKENLIRDPVIFFIYVKAKGLDKKIQAGDHLLSSSMGVEAIVDNLLKGTTDVRVTIPEGLRGEEINQILSTKFENYNAFWKQDLIKSNGYLFPDTYDFPKNAGINMIVSYMNDNFWRQIEQIGLTRDDKKISDIVIIASLIEREAKKPEERPLIASVIYNRLENGMPLQVDATVQYALALQNTNTWWKKDLTLDDLGTDSSFNTYKITGLPPAPICNPGSDSLKAAVHPDKTDYYYYVSDLNGITHFSKTLAEHQRNVVKYLNK